MQPDRIGLTGTEVPSDFPVDVAVRAERWEDGQIWQRLACDPGAQKSPSAIERAGAQ
jgi:hypothetical protein